MPGDGLQVRRLEPTQAESALPALRERGTSGASLPLSYALLTLGVLDSGHATTTALYEAVYRKSDGC